MWPVLFWNLAVPEVDFAVKIREVKAEEREDALFQCVLTAPMNEIKWFGKNAPLTNGEKHEIIVSEDKLIHKLIVRDCMPLDAGIYAAVAGIKSCNAWLVVEGEKMILFLLFLLFLIFGYSQTQMPVACINMEYLADSFSNTK